MKNKDFITRVIRCKECIHRYQEECLMSYYDSEFDIIREYTIDEGFCHYGEKEGE